MSKLFDFSGRESNERALQNTWAEFRQQLADGKFKYNEVEKAMNSTFLRVFDDLFQHGHRFLEKTVAETLSTDISIVRAARIKPGDPEPNYDRFIPNAKFITSDNRFSPPGVEWLYLAFAKESSSPEYKIEEQCALKECRATTGDRFALCNFQVDAEHKDGILIDLTIAKESNYEDINVKVSAAKTVEVEFTLKGDETEVSNSLEISVIKVDRSWYLDLYTMGNLF